MVFYLDNVAVIGRGSGAQDGAGIDPGMTCDNAISFAGAQQNSRQCLHEFVNSVGRLNCQRRIWLWKQAPAGEGSKKGTIICVNRPVKVRQTAKLVLAYPKMPDNTTVRRAFAGKRMVWAVRLNHG